MFHHCMTWSAVFPSYDISLLTRCCQPLNEHYTIYFNIAFHFQEMVGFPSILNTSKGLRGLIHQSFISYAGGSVLVSREMGYREDRTLLAQSQTQESSHHLESHENSLFLLPLRSDLYHFTS